MTKKLTKQTKQPTMSKTTETVSKPLEKSQIKTQPKQDNSRTARRKDAQNDLLQSKNINHQSEKFDNNDYKNFIVDPITIAFGKNIIFDSTKLIVNNGLHYFLVGHNGSGKTTLLNAVANRDIEIPEKNRYHLC